MKRLGTFSKDRSRPCTILVTLPRVWDARKALAKAPLLKTYDQNVYTSKGLSKTEIELENTILKKRRDELITAGVDPKKN